MKFLRHSLVAALFAVSAQQSFAYDEKLDKELRAETETIVNKYAQEAKELNGGYEITDLNHGVLKYIRDHAEEIGKEIEYLIDHSNPQAQLLFHYELDKLFRSFETYVQTISWTVGQPITTIINDKNTALLLVDIVSFGKSIKALAQQSLSADACPILKAAFEKMNIVEALVGDFIPLLQKYYNSFGDVPAKAQMQEIKPDLLKAITALKTGWFAYLDYMKTEEHSALLKNIVQAWVTFMKEDAFFEMLQFNAECNKKSEFGQQKAFFMPERLQPLMEAVNTYFEKQEAALRGVMSEETRALFEMHRFPFVRTAIVDDCDDFDAEDACDLSNDDCIEYDFNEQFKRAHAS